MSEVGSLVVAILSQMRIAKLSVPKSSKGSVWMSKSGGNLLSDDEMTAFSKSTQDLGSGEMADTIVNHLKALCQVQFLILQFVKQSNHTTEGLSIFPCWHPYQSLSPSAAQSGHLPQHNRMPSTQPPIHRPRLAIDIATFLAAQEERHSPNLVRQAPSLQRVQLPNFLSTASRSRSIVYLCRHAGLDEAGTDGIAPDACPGELVGGRLHHGDDGGFGGRVIGRPGVGP